jgi:hypothetical protein
MGERWKKTHEGVLLHLMNREAVLSGNHMNYG